MLLSLILLTVSSPIISSTVEVLILILHPKNIDGCFCRNVLLICEGETGRKAKNIIPKTSKISSQNIYYANTSVIIDFCVSKFGPTRIIKDDSLENDVTFTIVR